MYTLRNLLKYSTAALALTVLALTACTPNRALPTVAVLPSNTPSNTPTITWTPSATLTPSLTPTRTSTFTLTPSRTPTFTLTPSRTPTFTLTPSLTYTPTFTDTPITPTLTETPTLTPSRTPTITRTPRPTRTPSLTPSPTVMPAITTFTVFPDTVQVGSTVTVTWVADADKVTLEMVSGTSGAIIQTFSVEAAGSKTFTMNADNGNVINFRLTAVKAGKTVKAEKAINVQCAAPWFFSPPPSGCPPQPALQDVFIYQQFERGAAIFIPTRNTVYILASENSRVNAYPNSWVPGVIVPTTVPPAGFVDPINQIGLVYRNFTWNDGRSIQNVIGFATSQQLQYNSTYQFGLTLNDLYVRGPDLTVYQLGLGTLTWSVAGRANS